MLVLGGRAGVMPCNACQVNDELIAIETQVRFLPSPLWSMPMPEKRPGHIFHVQDSDRPMYIIAETWNEAVVCWKRIIADENDLAIIDVDEPLGIQLVCDPDEWASDLDLTPIVTE